MEYTINKLAKLARVSTRTLRYYDEIGLLVPTRINSNGYRIYGQKEIECLQQILFYREMGVPLEDIKKILSAKEFDAQSALQGHLLALQSRRAQLDALIVNVEKTIKTLKGECTMSDQEKFEGFISKLIEDNEQQYGKEVRQQYGQEAIERSNAKLRGMTPEHYAQMERLAEQIMETLKLAIEHGDPASVLAQQACELHKQWLCGYWDHYSKEAHRNIGQMYVDDSRFRAYYDAIAPGCAEFLRDALVIYTHES